MVCRGACADDIADCSLLCDLLAPLRTSDVNKEDLTTYLQPSWVFTIHVTSPNTRWKHGGLQLCFSNQLVQIENEETSKWNGCTNKERWCTKRIRRNGIRNKKQETRKDIRYNSYPFLHSGHKSPATLTNVVSSVAIILWDPPTHRTCL